MSNTPPIQHEELDRSIMIGFLYGIQSDFLQADEVRHRMAGFRTTKGYSEAMKLLKAHSEQVALEARIDTATDILYGFSRTYKQEVVDNQGNIYVQDSHGYISSYEVQELVANLQAQLIINQNKGADYDRTR